MAKQVTVIKNIDVLETKKVTGNCLYIFELLSRLFGTFDGTKFGISRQKNCWGRLRSHVTSSNIGKGHIIIFSNESELVAFESKLKAALPCLVWCGEAREVTSLTADEVLQVALELL